MVGFSLNSNEEYSVPAGSSTSDLEAPVEGLCGMACANNEELPSGRAKSPRT